MVWVCNAPRLLPLEALLSRRFKSAVSILVWPTFGLLAVMSRCVLPMLALTVPSAFALGSMAAALTEIDFFFSEPNVASRESPPYC